MTKKGFFLIECSIALLILTMLTGMYAWYLYQSLASQRMMTIRVAATTSMSNYIESLYSSGLPMHDDNAAILCQQVSIPLMTGSWASLYNAGDTSYRLLAIQMNMRNETGKEEHCVWYAGLMDQRD